MMENKIYGRTQRMVSSRLIGIAQAQQTLQSIVKALAYSFDWKVREV